MPLMTALSTTVTGFAIAQMQDLTATVDPSQSTLNACLTAIDITDCQSGAINGSLDFGIDQTTGEVKIDNFSLTVGQIDWTLDAGFLGGVDATLQNGATANYAGTTQTAPSSGGVFTFPVVPFTLNGTVDYNGYGIAGIIIGSGTETVDIAESTEISGTYSISGDTATVSVDLPIDYLFDLSGNEVAIQGGITVVASGNLPKPPSCPADLNNDGQIGFSDLSLILSAWEVSDAGDANGDGQTNFADINVVLSEWGNDC
ncbi:MAG: hypothetical protein CMJ30_06570 [Phycisphaerae bacterium]|jgi:hypothetical protein|nr:hypothetical protein [Phycisphaerae bacterium]